MMSDYVRIEFDTLPGRKYELKYRTERIPSQPVGAVDRETIMDFKMWVEEVK